MTAENKKCFFFLYFIVVPKQFRRSAGDGDVSDAVLKCDTINDCAPKRCTRRNWKWKFNEIFSAIAKWRLLFECRISLRLEIRLRCRALRYLGQIWLRSQGMETHGKMPLNISSSKFFRAIANAFFFCRFAGSALASHPKHRVRVGWWI